MPYALSIKATGPTAAKLRDLWSVFSRFESEPSMQALDYPPHVTLAIYDRIEEPVLRNALTSVFDRHPALELRFESLRCFDDPGFVVWAAPERSESLSEAFAAVHELIDPSICREHYRPGNWIPHCTLATGVTGDFLAAARELADNPIEPFEVIFDMADCVEFAPVRVIDERQLPTAE